MTDPGIEKAHIEALSALALTPRHCPAAQRYAADLPAAERARFSALTDSHHVVLRALAPVRDYAVRCRKSDVAEWADKAIAAEQLRIQSALKHLHFICCELEAEGCPATVIKSLDHWPPDLGNDLDLYTSAGERAVVEVMRRRFGAALEARSWGDRLANKWNFRIPGLRESVEIHVQRLGQTGEHTRLARRFITRRVTREVGGYRFLVPAPEERVIVATLQRMYRHFYFRICDVCNTARLIEEEAIDYSELERAARLGGIWPGVATYLKVVADYAAKYREVELPLPPPVAQAALFGAGRIYVKDKFLRVPMLPEGARLYSSEVTTLAMKGDVPATFRLSLLPPLASMAALAYKVTGSDKGVW
ncbi:MAG: nucleotidyltransferase family protein [Acidobacteria bacterium]|nr:nucleotidyltransferase family protein [Acidobacteriota bacterium]